MVDREKIEEAMEAVIAAIGDDPGREGLRETPRRVAKMYSDFFSGLSQDPKEVLATVFEEDHHDLVVFRDIPFYSICEHHLLPFYGSAQIGYVPSGRVVGASKLARALDILARRPQVQERLTDQLVDTIYEAVHPQGVAAVLKAEHMCVTIRGVKKPGSSIVTSSSRGTLRTQAGVRSEFLALLSD